MGIKGYKRLRFSLDVVLHSAFGVSFECKHSPTCSDYTIDQIEKHGTIRGLLKGGYRILTCW